MVTVVMHPCVGCVVVCVRVLAYYLLPTTVPRYLGTYIVPTAYCLASAYAYYLLLVPTPTTYCRHLLPTAYYLLLVPTTYYLLIVIQHSLS